MLRQHIEPADLQPFAIELTRHHRVTRGFAFQHLEAVGRHEHCAAGIVKAVVGAADALHKSRCAFGAPMQITLSTAPQSMPRSRVEVQTTARRLPFVIALSTLRRCAGASEP
ncbi:MAG: hypothetical protein WDM89_01060 [Rhizomicrobium sp.]